MISYQAVNSLSPREIGGSALLESSSWAKWMICDVSGQ